MERKVRSSIIEGKSVSIGLEDAKRSWKLCVRSENRIIHETSMASEYPMLRGYLKNGFPNCKITVIYEAGFSGFWLHDLLVADGFSCVVTPPHTVIGPRSTRTKNDRIDSRRLAKNLEKDDCGSCHIPTKQQREDRQVSRRMCQVQDNIVRVKNQIRRTLEFHGLNPCSRKEWSDRDYKDLADWIKKAGIGETLMFSFESLLRELSFLRDEKRLLLGKLRTLARCEAYKRSVTILKTVPGIGILTAIRLTLEWGDLNRFRRKEEFVKFLGIIPSEFSTGESERLGHITKEGSGRVRAWLIEVAWIIIRHDPAMREKFDVVAKGSRVRGNPGKSAKIAIVAVARKLAIRLRALLITGESYQLGIIQ